MGDGVIVPASLTEESVEDGKLHFFRIDSDTGVPKYAQIVQGAIEAIRRGDLKRGDQLPSVSDLCQHFGLARETVIKAYQVLKRRGIVDAKLRRGYFVRTEAIEHAVRVLLLFDELSAYKQVLYNAFLGTLAGQGIADIFFHHYNIETFEHVIRDGASRYNQYVIMPFQHERIPDIVNALEPDRVLMLDRCECVGDAYPRITQHIEGAIYEGLCTGQVRFKKYDEIVLVFPRPSHHPEVIIHDFMRFCEDRRFKGSIVHAMDEVHVRKGIAYIVIDDDDLVEMVERCQKKNFRLGKDVGLVSYNETRLKRVVAGGIAVITTDFAEMGRRAAKYVLKPDKRHELIPTRIIPRPSL